GLILILGPEITPDVLSAFLGSAGERRASDSVIVTGTEAGQSAFAGQIPWRSAPQVGERTIPVGLEARTLLESRTGDPLILQLELGRGRIFAVTPWFASGSPAAPEAANYQFQTWSYFPYLLAALIARASGSEPPSFAAWAEAPVPNARERGYLAVLFASLLALTTGLFVAVRRYSHRHPEALDDFVRANFGRHELEAEEQTG